MVRSRHSRIVGRPASTPQPKLACALTRTRLGFPPQQILPCVSPPPPSRHPHSPARTRSLRRPPRRSAEEDRLIWEAVDELGQKWRLVAQRLIGRSDDAVRNRLKRLHRERIAKDPDYAATQAAAQSTSTGGEGSQDSAGVGGEGEDEAAASGGEGAAKAASKAERLPWTPAEDTEIVRSVQQIGLKWQKIAARLPSTRTPHAVRNRFYRLQQLQQQQAQTQQPPMPPPPPPMP